MSSPVTRRSLPVAFFFLLLLTTYDSRFTAPSSALDLGKVENLMNALEKKLEQAAPAKTGSKRTMTGGVRAAQQKEQIKLYWRGKPKRTSIPRPAEDLAKAQQILALLREKKTEQARAEIDAFAKAFPESPFKAELDSISRELAE
ncbi:MAG: hypothetical protein HYT87_11895 [Nitrospirae bacterium]|nr:hypothetical protein [Nitrospirota bacterium]